MLPDQELEMPLPVQMQNEANVAIQSSEINNNPNWPEPDLKCVKNGSTVSSSSAPLRCVLLLSITILIPETALVGVHAHAHTPASVASCAVLYCSALELS